MPDLRYGVLLPHFGSQARPDRLIEGARQIEAYGFDSVWVRDHLVFHPHEHEDQDRTHVDPFVVLSGIATVTTQLTLATGTLIPHRHPILAALMLGSLDWLSGGRVLAGWGFGNYDHEFEAIGEGGWDRRVLLEEHVRVIRELHTGKPVDHAGTYHQFTGVDVHPVPGDFGRAIPIWYGGSSPAAVRRAVEYCDGWIPGRMPVRDFRKRMTRMRRLAGEAGREVPTAGNIPYVVPGKTVEEAISYLNLPDLLHDSAKMYELPESGEWRTIDDLDGAAIAGPKDVIIEYVRRYQAEGLEHFVFDMRAAFSKWEENLTFLGEEVLPELHKGDGRV